MSSPGRVLVAPSAALRTPVVAQWISRCTR